MRREARLGEEKCRVSQLQRGGNVIHEGTDADSDRFLRRPADFGGNRLFHPVCPGDRAGPVSLLRTEEGLSMGSADLHDAEGRPDGKRNRADFFPHRRADGSVACGGNDSVHYLLGGLLESWGGLFRRWREEYTLADLDIRGPLPVEFATGCFMFIRTSVFQKLEGFDPRFFLYQEDSDLSRRILEMNLGSIVYHPDMVVTHRWARENTRTLRGCMRQVRSIFKYFLKWGISW